MVGELRERHEKETSVKLYEILTCFYQIKNYNSLSCFELKNKNNKENKRKHNHVCSLKTLTLTSQNNQEILNNLDIIEVYRKKEGILGF